MEIIAFTGKSKVGKTTCAKYLADNYGYKIVSFAEPIKEEIAQMLASIHHLYSDGQKIRTYTKVYDDLNTVGKKEKYRELMQAYGSLKRAEDKNYWIIKAFDSIDSFYGKFNNKIVIDDLRYLNEADYLKNRNTTIIKIIRDPYSSLEDSHPSEIEWRMIKEDLLISNNKALEDLYRELRNRLQL